MTNAQIIFNAEQELAEQGIIQYTGKETKVTLLDGTEATIKETEAIHTFAAWKSIGYKVKKGQKAIIKLTIWKYAPKKTQGQTEDGKAVEIIKDRAFMKTAAFFSASQVEKIA